MSSLCVEVDRSKFLLAKMPGNKTREAESTLQSVRGIARVQLGAVRGAQHHGQRGLPAALEKVLPQ